MNKSLLLILLICFGVITFGQQPKYSKKCFVVDVDSSDFQFYKNLIGKDPMFVKTNHQIWDLDDNNSTHVVGGEEVTLLIDGQFEKDKKNGLFTAYLIDCNDHKIIYKIWEQTYLENKLNGEWKNFNLKGTLVQIKNFKNDSLDGVSRTYWIDGKRIIDEIEYFNGTNKFIQRQYFENGNLAKEIPYFEGKVNGFVKNYYENGILMEKVEIKMGIYDGVREYYYPAGQLWIASSFKNGKYWSINENYDINGKKREPGTLKNGNGTIIYYNEDNTIREVQTFKNGELIK